MKYVIYIYLTLLVITQGFLSHTSSTGVRVMVLNATFNKISVISWWSVLSLKETGVPGENHRPATSH